jgi:outer membrane protein OmpA-like peptidoglycan-associated protein
MTALASLSGDLMAKRCLILVVLLILGWSSTAFATLTATPDTIAFGDVVVGAEDTETSVITTDDAITGDEVDDIAISGTGCSAALTVTPEAALPELVTILDPLDLAIKFEPAVRGALTCTVTLLDAANAPIASIVVTGRGVGPVVNAPATVSFTAVRFANPATSTANIVIGNIGETTLSITSVVIGGTNAADFSVTANPSATVAPGGNTNVGVTFNPSAAGARTATLTINSDGTNDPVTVTLNGTGLAARIGVTDVSFGIVNVGSSDTDSISVTNAETTNPGPLRITGATINGGDGWFTFGATTGCTGTTCNFGSPGNLAPQTVNIVCTPPAGASDSMTATVTFTSDTDAGGDNSAGISCEAGRADASPDPTTINFGQVVEVGTTVQQVVDVTNTGNINLIYTVTKTGIRNGEYALTGCITNCIVAPNATQSFTLAFTPTQRGDADITLSLSGDLDGPVTIPVDARSIAPVVAQPGTVQFGNVEVLVTDTATLQITNSGDAVLDITSANFGVNDGSYAIAVGSTGAQTVDPGASASWTLECTPANTGAHNGTFLINSDALGTPTITAALRCNGTEGILVVATNPITNPVAINFGGVPEDTVATRPFTLRNAGNLPVSNIAGVIDPNNLGYTIDPTTPIPASLPAGQQVTINVLFSPLDGDDGGPADLTFSGTWGTGAKPLRTPPVLLLDGDGLVSGYDTNPDALAFGDVRFDQTRTLTFCIVNTGSAGSDVTISNITISPATGTGSSEFRVPVNGVGAVQVRRKTCGAAVAGTLQTLPQVVPPQITAANQQLEVTVTVDPDNRTGAMAATLTVASTLPSNPNRDVALTATSTSATLALAPGATVDFGALDIQAAPATTNITITNNGDGPLDLGSFARSDGGTNTRFAFTLPSDTTLQPAQVLTIPVTYTPDAITLPEEQITLTHTISGDIAAPVNQTIVIKGRGIDREIELTAATAFPDTFRNPGAGAPVRAVTVTNTGEAPLAISAVMISTGDPSVWTLVDASPQTIPGGASFDYLVRFTPNAIGPAPAATLILTSDDSSEPMAEITFSGNGIDRNVAFGAPRISLGFTGVGIPVTLDNALLVASMNASTGFRITTIDVAEADPNCLLDGMTTDAAAFTVEDPPVGDELPASEQRTFGLTFVSNEPGRFVASARLFIDEDPEPQATICVEGTAVFVDARGGGGCQAGGEVGGGLLLWLGLGILMLRRRRMRIATTGAVIAIAAMPASADKLAISIFDPTPSTTGTQFQLQSADVGHNGDYVLSVAVSHATDPLILDGGADGQAQVIQRSTQMVLGGAFAFADRFEAGARIPFYVQDGAAAGDPSMMFTADPASGAAMGDITMHGKVRLWRNRGASLAGGVQLTIPTAEEGSFTGTQKPSLRALGIASIVPNAFEHRLSLTGHVGAIARAKSSFANIEQGSGGTWGAGISVRALDRMWLAAEMFGDVLPSARKATATTNAVSLSPIEWLAGIRYMPDHRLSIGLAMGRGLTAAAGSPSLRGVLEVTYAPNAAELRPIRTPLPPKPDLDADGDGIKDSVDQCKTEAEDADLFDDTDGCPDLDNDKDGIADVADKCPLDPEDLDKFEDTDGCPDKDNDSDMIADVVDKCPNEAEDKDGHDDLDGCPDDDNDGDGIADGKDKCPSQAETINGNKDEDGCPDAGDSSIVLSPDRIETLDAIQFDRGNKVVIAKASFNVLGQIGSTMRAHPEIVRVRVTCHVHPSGNYEKDQELSDKRAQAVRDWLVQWGLTAGRVEARGFGSSKPLAPPDQKGAQLINDRIEMIILERK